MVLAIDDEWVWDFWLADDGRQYHLYFLHASRGLGDEAMRHRAARIGHAISTDLRNWIVLGDIFDVGPLGDFDDTATWTGSVVQGSDGLWRMFYTGARFHRPWPDPHNTESIGVAVSDDLHHWRKLPGPVVTADPIWYETFGTSTWREEAWRDPWVYPDPSGRGWHMLVTARAGHGPVDDRGVIGHAVSSDLATWMVLPSVTPPGLGFQHMEVPQLLIAPNGAQSILFSCSHEALADRLRLGGTRGGVWAIPVDDNARASANSEAVLVSSERLYSARIIRDRDGEYQMLAVDNLDPSAGFIGRISDPMAIDFDARAIPRLKQPVLAG